MARRNGGFIGTDGLDAPDPPTGVSASGVDGQASVFFTAPTDTGTSAITGFVAQVASSGDNYSAGSNTGTSSPIAVSSLTNGTSYTAKVWAINAYGTSAPSDASAAFSPAASSAFFAGGRNQDGSVINVISSISMPSSSNASDFGDLTTSRRGVGGIGSSTRGVFSGGASSNVMDYITFASAGNATDFGDLSYSNVTGSVNNATRGVNIDINDTVTMEYITIASTGNATDFGDRSASISDASTCGSSTRGIMAGNSASNEIQYITIATTGNTTDFGDISFGNNPYLMAGSSNSTRGVFGGGYSNSSPTILNIIQYITIASTGNSTDFGDLTLARSTCFGAANATKALFAGGENASNLEYNVIDFVTISSTGNATDFGDLTEDTKQAAGTSNAHGGLS